MQVCIDFNDMMRQLLAEGNLPDGFDETRAFVYYTHTACDDDAIIVYAGEDGIFNEYVVDDINTVTGFGYLVWDESGSEADLVFYTKVVSSEEQEALEVLNLSSDIVQVIGTDGLRRIFPVHSDGTAKLVYEITEARHDMDVCMALPVRRAFLNTNRQFIAAFVDADAFAALNHKTTRNKYMYAVPPAEGYWSETIYTG